MSQQFKDANLSGNSLNISLLYYFLFLQCFYSNFLICWDVNGLPDFAERAFSYRLALIMSSVPTL